MPEYDLCYNNNSTSANAEITAICCGYWTVMGNAIDDSANLKRTDLNQTDDNNLTSGQTYKYDQFGQQLLTDLPTRQPYPSCFNFFAPAQNILKFFGSRTNGTFGFAPTAQADPSGKSKRAVFCQRFIKTTCIFTIKLFSYL